AMRSAFFVSRSKMTPAGGLTTNHVRSSPGEHSKAAFGVSYLVFGVWMPSLNTKHETPNTLPTARCPSKIPARRACLLLPRPPVEQFLAQPGQLGHFGTLLLAGHKIGDPFVHPPHPLGQALDHVDRQLAGHGRFAASQVVELDARQ